MTTHSEHDVENERHRAECADCQALWHELEAISAEASQLPPLTPSRDLWGGIEARLDAHDAPVRGTAPTRPFHASQTFRLAMAASLLVAVSAGVTWRLATTPTPAATVVANDATAPQTPAAGLQLAGLDETVGAMDREIAALEMLLRERRSELDSTTLAVLERSLAVIDTAIAESRAALAADPASKTVTRQYTRAYTAKLTLLRDAATRPTGI